LRYDGCQREFRSLLERGLGSMDQRAPIQQMQETGAMSETSPSILVVDDSSDAREMMKFVLQMKGYRVLEAEDGQKGVEIAKREHPDLILMDLSMPILDGYAAVRYIREATEISNVPIVACSADDGERARALTVGFNEFVSKPVDLTELESLVSHLTVGGGATQLKNPNAKD
jgi:CheY-like chemotaxis protein